MSSSDNQNNSSTCYENLKGGWEKYRTAGLATGFFNYLNDGETSDKIYKVTCVMVSIAAVASVWYMWPRIVSNMPFMEKVSNGIGAVTGPVGNALTRMYLVAAVHPFAAVASLIGLGLAIHTLTYVMNKKEPSQELVGVGVNASIHRAGSVS